MTLKLLLKKGIKVEHLLVWGESLLVIQQAIRNFEVKKAHLVVCKAKEIMFKHIPHSTNHMADALTMLGSRFFSKALSII